MAVRAIRSCQGSGAKVVAVHSSPEADAQHVRCADEAVLIGDAAPESSYLNIPAVVEAARVCGAQALLPVHSVLTASAELAVATEAAGLLWLGPDPEAIEAVSAAGLASGVAHQESAGLVVGVADGYRIDGLVVRRIDPRAPRLYWTSADEANLADLAGASVAAQLLAVASDRVVELGWRGLVSVPFAVDGSLLAIRGGVPFELSLVELRAGRDLVRAALTLAEGSTPPAGAHGFPSAVGANLRATGLIDGGSSGQLTDVTGPPTDPTDAAEAVRWDSGFVAGDRVWPFYDSTLATLAVAGPDLAAAVAAFRSLAATIDVVGVPNDLHDVRERADLLAGSLSVDR